MPRGMGGTARRSQCCHACVRALYTRRFLCVGDRRRCRSRGSRRLSRPPRREEDNSPGLIKKMFWSS